MGKNPIRRFEKLREPLATKTVFRQRLISHALIGLAVIGCTLVVGMAGSAFFGGMRIVDAFLFSSMILAGMGPVGDITPDSMKIFAGIYAIFCGVLILAIAAYALAPVIHRALHLVHADDKD